MRKRRCISAVALACALCHAAPATAGSFPYSESYLDGYFLAEGYTFWTEGIVYAYLPPGDFRDRLTALCKMHGRLWVYDRSEKFYCHDMTAPPPEQGGDGPDYFTIKIDGRKHGITPAITSRPPALVFSLAPFRQIQYAKRKLTAEEIGLLRPVLAQHAVENRDAISALHQGAAWAVQDQSGNVPFFIVRSTPLLQDVETYSHEYKHLVMRHMADGSWSRIEIDGSIIGFIDLDGNGLPAIQVSLDCDGTCKSLVSPTQDKQLLLDISVH